MTFPPLKRDFRFSVQKEKYFPLWGLPYFSLQKFPPSFSPFPSGLGFSPPPPWFSSLFLGKEVLLGEAECSLYPFRISVGTLMKRQLTKREEFNMCGDITQENPKIKSSSKW